MKLNKTEKHLLLIIRKIQGKNDFCRLKNSWLAEQIGVSIRSVQRARRKLECLDLVSKKEIPGRTNLISILPINTESANIVKLKLLGMTKLKRGQFTFQSNGESILLEDPKSEADKISFILHVNNLHPLEKIVIPKETNMSSLYRQSILDNLHLEDKSSRESDKSNSKLFEIPEKPKKRKKENSSDLVKIEKFIFNLWKYIGKDYYYNYPKERRQIKNLLKIANVNEICNRFNQLYELTLTNEFYKSRPLTPTGLTYHVLNTLQSLNKDTKQKIQSEPFVPIIKKNRKQKYSFFLELSAWKKGFKSYAHESRSRQLSARKTYKKDEIFF